MLAAGAEGVWVLTDQGVARIDPAKNRLGPRIPLPFGNARDIAVGGGAVWVTDDPQGLLWRIDVGRSPTARSIDVGVGAFYVAYGAGAVWVGNFVTGTVSRVDPRTNRVTARVPVGAVQSLAVGERRRLGQHRGRDPRAGRCRRRRAARSTRAAARRTC